MAKVLTSISGLPISAASAGFSPTNSADVSAIASAYQVVSATGTQLYAGTAYVTSVNSAPLSASRAGNAANASMANSAYYDGTGRLISSLPDSATVSSIASSYAESAASGKLDKTAQVVTATAGDGTYVTSINGQGISGQGGGGGAQVVTATGSATATAGFWPVTTSYLVSSINGSALLPYGFTSVSTNSAGWNSTNSTVTVNSAKWNSVYDTVSGNSASWAGGSVTSPSGTIVVMNGNEIEGTNSAVLTANGEGFETLISPANGQIATYMQILSYGNVPGTGATLLIPLAQAASWETRVTLSGLDSDHNYASASGFVNPGDVIARIPMGGITGELSAASEGWLNLSAGAPLTAKKDGGIVVTGVGELAWKSAVDNVTNTVATNSASWGQGGGGGVDSATVSAIASSYAESAASSKLDTTSFSTVSGTFLTAHQDITASANWDSTYNTVSTNSASWGQGGGGGAAFPAEIKTGDTLKAVITTGFQGNTATRPTLFISSDPNTTAYPRMMLSENHTDIAQGKSAAFLADAFEFYTGTGSKVFRADRTSISASGLFYLGSSLVSAGNSTNKWYLNRYGVSGRATDESQWLLNRSGVSGTSDNTTWRYTTAEYALLQSLSAWATANGWTGA